MKKFQIPAWQRKSQLNVFRFQNDIDFTWYEFIKGRLTLLSFSFLFLFGYVQSFQQVEELAYNNIKGISKGANDFLAHASPYADSLCIESTSVLSNNYTNPGFMLAGLITETVSGTYYREY